jgi:hypothetical protein
MPDSSYVRVGAVVSNDLTVTTAGSVDAPRRKPSKLTYYWHVMRWMWQHREEPNNRAKWRRMAKEIVC